jgi:YidC/Oxa1 family membrane protein insertase
LTAQQEENPVGIRNWIGFIAFSMVAFFAFQMLFPQPERPAPPAAMEPPAGAETGEPGSSWMPSESAETAAAAVEPQTPATATAAESGEVSRLSVLTSHARAELTNVGGRITSWTLPDHPSYWDKDAPVDLVPGLPPPEPAEGEESEKPLHSLPVRDDAPMLPLQVITGDAALDAHLAQALHVVEQDEPEPGRKRVTMRWSDGAGTAVEKILTFRDELPVTTIEARLTVNGTPRSFHLGWGPGIGDHSTSQGKNIYFRRGRLVYGVGGDVEHEDRPDKAEDLPGSTVDYAGIEDSFFQLLFIPGSPDDDSANSLRTGFRLGGTLPPKDNGKAGSNKDWPEHLVLEVPFSPAAAVQSFYTGARDRDTLERVDAAFAGHRALKESANLGAFIGPIAHLMHRGLIWLQGYVQNWGVAIILLTLLIRGVLFPLTHSSLKKMRLMQDKMKIAKPKIDAVKAKFKKLPRDMETRQREQAETMAVYKQMGINPADQIMGCLPMLISTPFFFALFRLLQAAPEFRHQAFLGWADLSAADPTHFWPILTGATTFLSQKIGMSQSSGNSEMESMQRNMLIMFPIMFVFFCWSAPLGLVVYWTTNNLVQIGQQFLLKMTLPQPEPAVEKDGKSKSKNKSKSKSKK